jgi:hypothetical protein
VEHPPDGGSLPSGFGVGANSLIEAPVTIGPYGNVWYGTNDGYLCANTAAGGTLFQIPYASQGLSHFFNSPAASFDERMFFAAPGGTGSNTVDRAIYAGTADGGASLFYLTANGVQAQLAVDGAGNVYAISATQLVSVAPDGGLRWTFGLGDSVQTGMAFGADGTIYVGTVGGNIISITP